jgi:hypothetical protein
MAKDTHWRDDVTALAYRVLGERHDCFALEPDAGSAPGSEPEPDRRLRCLVSEAGRE